MNQIHHGEAYGFTWSSTAPASVNHSQYASQGYNAYAQAPYSGDYYQTQIPHMHHSPQANYHHPQYHHPNMTLTPSMSHLTSHHLNPVTSQSQAASNDIAVAAAAAAAAAASGDDAGYVLPEQKYPPLV